MQIQQLQSDTQLKGIARLVLSYEREHKRPPKRMSEIVPTGRTDLLEIFYAPNRWLTNQALLEEFSDYGFSSYQKTGILAFEKPSLWLDSTVAVCFTNLDVKRIHITRFKELLNAR
jgi:hypothetical protein